MEREEGGAGEKVGREESSAGEVVGRSVEHHEDRLQSEDGPSYQGKSDSQPEGIVGHGRLLQKWGWPTKPAIKLYSEVMLSCDPIAK